MTDPAFRGQVLWEPDPGTIERSQQTRYLRWLAERGIELAGYPELWQWSVDEPGAFWDSLWDFFEIEGTRRTGPVVEGTMPEARWFAGAEVNFGEHLLRGKEGATAVIAADEAFNRSELTYGELRARVGAAQAGLRELGVTRGERVVALMPNTLDTLVVFIACAGLGAIWSSCSPEFGTQAVIDRFAQLEPAVLLAVSSYAYGGKRYDKLADLEQLQAALPTLRHTVVQAGGAEPGLGGAVSWAALEAEAAEPTFERVPFDHPLWVLYSSGTTGLPKGIVHSHGGILIESFKQVVLHLDLGPTDRFFWFTTTGWMMWNVVVTGLMSGGTTVLYDGSPGYPDLMRLWRLAEDEELTFLGVSAAFVQQCAKAGIDPSAEFKLEHLRSLGSTGSPLSPEGFAWLRERVKPGVPIFSVSGGTDICSCFIGASNLLPVRAGELQCRALGVSVKAFDEVGQEVVGEVGELVVDQPMPSMPIRLWNDEDGERYRETYFSMYPGIWRHGDWISFTESGSAVIHGRSDATLNRGGIRMGSSEFYRVVEALPEIADSLVVEDGPDATTARLVLFVVPREHAVLDDALRDRIKAAVRAGISPRHVPDEIAWAPAVPRTLNGKKLEVPVKRLLQGIPVEKAVSLGSVGNPESLEFFAQLGAERSEARR